LEPGGAAAHAKPHDSCSAPVFDAQGPKQVRQTEPSPVVSPPPALTTSFIVHLAPGLKIEVPPATVAVQSPPDATILAEHPPVCKFNPEPPVRWNVVLLPVVTPLVGEKPVGATADTVNTVEPTWVQVPPVAL